MIKFLIPIVLVILCPVSLAFGETINDLVERDGLYFKKFTDTPFSGVLSEGNSQGRLKSGRKEGKWTSYHDNGQLKSIGNYENSIKEGEWVTRNRDGSLRFKANFKNGVREGQWEAYDEYGSLKEKGNFKEGKKEGKWTKYYEFSKNISAEENYKNDNLTSRIEYFENGNLQSKAFYKMGKLNGSYIEYFENGTDIKVQGTYLDDKREGEWAFFDAPGKKRFSSYKRTPNEEAMFNELKKFGFSTENYASEEGSGIYKDDKKISD